jgi:hypothetical protein
LDEILDIQISPNDQYGLGYNKEVAHLEVGSSKNHYAGLSFKKTESRDASQEMEQRKKIFRKSEQGRHQEAGPTPQSNFRRETPSRWTQKQRYGDVFNGHCFSCNEYGNKALDCINYARKYVGRFNSILICWRFNQVEHIASHFHTMRCTTAVGLATNPNIFGTQEDNS